MTGARRGSAPLLLGLALVMGGPAALGAQTLDGVALGPDGSPLGGAAVALHRVGSAGSAFVDTDTTDANGSFRFELRPDSAIYFAAVRFDGRMYLGPAVQPGSADVGGYVLRIDPANEAGAVASALSGQAPPPSSAPARGTGATSSDNGALLLVGLLALAAAAAFFFAAPRYRERQTREALIELARIENALAEADARDRAGLEADRDRLRERLAPRT